MLQILVGDIISMVDIFLKKLLLVIVKSIKNLWLMKWKVKL